MKNKLIVTFMILILGIGLVFSLYYVNNQELAKADIVEINNVEKTAEDQWDAGKLTLPEEKFKFKIIDLRGNVKYSNINEKSDNEINNDYDAQIENSIKNKDTIADITVNNQIAGKLIVLNDVNSIELLKKHLNIIIIIVFSLLAIIIVLYFIYLNTYLYKPFKKLKSFAGKIAEGDLDAPLEMDKANVFGAFTESFDIMREQLKISRYNEYLANRSKKELVASLSHDIKTPVASIKAICEIMQLKLSNEDEVNKVCTIFQKSDQIEKLVNDMFQSTLEELQELKVNPDIYSSHIIEEFIKNNDFYGKLEMKSRCPECLIVIDKLRIGQVIDNIINNSYKYANTTIEIGFKLSKTYLEVSFKDFGKGISCEELPLIFNKFYRGKDTNDIMGSGLGLYLAQYFMKNMQGGIECFNASDGFEVNIYIKLA